MKKNKLPNIVVLMILTLITTFFWLSFSVYRIFSDEKPVVVEEKILLPLSPQLDQNTIDLMETKNYP